MSNEQTQVNAESRAKVQTAWNKVTHLQSEIKNTEQVYKTLVLISQLENAIVELWKTIADVTSDINPSLVEHVKNHPDQYIKLSQADMCFIDRNWEVLDSNTRCEHCGKVHKRHENDEE